MGGEVERGGGGEVGGLKRVLSEITSIVLEDVVRDILY